MAPADACEATSDAGEGTVHSPNIALNSLLDLQSIIKISACGGLHVNHAGKAHSWLHAYMDRKTQSLQSRSPAALESHSRSCNCEMLLWHSCGAQAVPHRVDLRSVASKWWWGGLQHAAPRLDLQRHD